MREREREMEHVVVNFVNQHECNKCSCDCNIARIDKNNYIINLKTKLISFSLNVPFDWIELNRA